MSRPSKPTWSLTAFAGPSETKFEGAGEFDLVCSLILTLEWDVTQIDHGLERFPILSQKHFSWGTWVEVHPSTAEKLGLVKNKGVTLKTANGEINAGWYGVPGVRDTLAVVVGGGKSKSGRYAAIGANPLSLINHGFDDMGNITFSKHQSKHLRE